MATNAELARPGVEVLQTFRSSSPTFLRPTLIPVVVGPSFEVINVLTTDGTINSKSRYGNYLQIGKTITHSSFPDPRGNIDELDILPESIKPYMLSGGHLAQLPMSPGEGFLNASHIATKPVFKISGNAFSVNGKTFVIAIDQPNYADYTADITITFPGTSALSPAQICDTINAAVGTPVATVVTGGWELASTRYGALASITVRAGGTANSYFNLGWINGVAATEKLTGAGYRAQDQGDNTNQSPWIEYYRGGYSVNGDVQSPPGSRNPMEAWFESIDGSRSASLAAEVSFSSASTLPIQEGDQIFADGQRVVSGEIIRVETSRFKVGTVNPTLSTADANGNYTYKVYDPQMVGLLTNAVDPFSPTYVWFKATGLTEAGTPTPAYMLSGSAAEPAEAAIVRTSSAAQGPFVLDGLTLHVLASNQGVTTDTIFPFPTGTYEDMSAVAAAIVIPGVTAEVGANEHAGKLVLTTLATGRTVSIVVMPDGSANSSLLFSTVTNTIGTGKDPEKASLAGTQLKFSFDRSAHVYDLSFPSDSMLLAVDAINTLVGAPVASLTEARLLKLTSPLAGVASQVKVFTGTSANPILVMGHGADQISTTGAAGRPLPDAYLDDSGNLVIGHQILRDPVTGAPNDFISGQGVLYIQFKALRKDVSASAQDAGVVRIPDIATLQSVLDPITEENPGGLGSFLCMLNCPSFEIKYLGIDEVSGSAPDGTELAWARAAAFLESEEAYAIAPLTQNTSVLSMWSTHVTVMSEPDQGGERIVFINKEMPVRENSVVAASGSQASSTATANQLLLDVAPQAGLVNAGLNPTMPFEVSSGLYIEFDWESLNYRYSVSSVTGGLVNVRATVPEEDNADGFYTVGTLPVGIINVPWSLKVRGASLYIPGSNPAKLDYSSVADTVSQANTSIGNRRVYSVFPDTIKMTIDGMEKSVPGYYACAAAAGMTAGLSPQQGFTNYPIVGLTGVVGTERFTRRQLNRMAGGGTYILMQEVQGGAVFSRHQLSTDTTSVETRELSITKVVDFTAKFMRTSLRRFIGRQNINAVFLDTLGTTIQGMLTFLTEGGVLNGAYLNNIIQDSKAPDTVLIDVTLDVPFPCNYIRLTLVI
jgi:hypothetical protein